MFEANRFRTQTSKLSLAGAAPNIIFVATKVLSHQTHFCRNKTRTKQTHTRRDKSFVVTSLLLLRQTRVCRDKTRDDVFSRDKRVCLSRQKLYFWQLPPLVVNKQTNPYPAWRGRGSGRGGRDLVTAGDASPIESRTAEALTMHAVATPDGRNITTADRKPRRRWDRFPGGQRSVIREGQVITGPNTRVFENETG